MKSPMPVTPILFLLMAFVAALLGCGKSGDSTPPALRKPQEGRYLDIPIGGVILWWGAKEDIPPGFELCDGQNPTTDGAALKGKKPDLRDRFVKGPQPDDGKTADLGTGGADRLDLSHTHGSSNLTAQIGTHDQPFLLSYKARGRGFKDATWELRGDSARRATGGPNSATAIAGETDPALNKAVDNRPAFQEMFFIIRVK